MVRRTPLREGTFRLAMAGYQYSVRPSSGMRSRNPKPPERRAPALPLGGLCWLGAAVSASRLLRGGACSLIAITPPSLTISYRNRCGVDELQHRLRPGRRLLVIHR